MNDKSLQIIYYWKKMNENFYNLITFLDYS